MAAQYAETPIGSLPNHKFQQYTEGSAAFHELPESTNNTTLKYLIEVYVDDYINLVLATSKEQLRHVSSAILHGIHDVFPADDNDDNDPISLKKLRKHEGRYDTTKELLGFDFDGVHKTMWLAEGKRACSSPFYTDGSEQLLNLSRGSPLKSLNQQYPS